MFGILYPNIAQNFLKPRNPNEKFVNSKNTTYVRVKFLKKVEKETKAN